MRKLLTILFCIFGYVAKAQTEIPQVFGSRYYEFKNTVRIDSGFLLPRSDTFFKRSSLVAPGDIRWRPQDSAIYYYNGVYWPRILTMKDLTDLSDDFIRNGTLSQNANFNITGNGAIGNTLKIATTNPLAAPLNVGTLPSYLNLSAFFEGTIQHDPASNGNEGVTLSQLNDSLLRPSVYVERYRSPGMTDWEVLNAAVQVAGINGTIDLQPGRVYTVDNALVMPSGLTIRGNRATIKREAESTTTLSVAAPVANTSFTVAAIPVGWKVGDQVQLYFDSTCAGSAIWPKTITNISGNVISVADTLGTNAAEYDPTGHSHITEWPIGATVRKVFALVTSPSLSEAVTKFTVNNYFDVLDVVFDGNKSANRGNYSWSVNQSVYNSGFQVKLDRCEFYDIPNENIYGHGYSVTNCIAKRLNGSFFHTTANDTLLPKAPPTMIIGNVTDSTNQVAHLVVNGHSRGVFETSYSGGYTTIANNRFSNGGEACWGRFSFARGDTAEAATRELLIVNNYFKNFRNIQYPPGIPGFTGDVRARAGHIFIDGNVFDNCGASNTWSNTTLVDTVLIGDNLLVGGTVWPIPQAFLPNTMIWNNPLPNPAQTANINVSGNIRASGTGSINGVISQATELAGNAVAAMSLTIAGSATNNGTYFFQNDNGNLDFFSGYLATDLMRMTKGGNIGVRLNTPTSRLHINGSVAKVINTITASTTLDDTHYCVNFNNTSNITVNLPAAATCSGRIYVIKKTSNNAFTISVDPNASENIEGSSTPYSITTYLQSITIQSDGTAWWIY